MCTNRNVSDMPLSEFSEWQRPTSNNSGEILQRRTNPDTGHDELFRRKTVTEQAMKKSGFNFSVPEYEVGPTGTRGAPVMRERTTHTKVGDAPGSAAAGYRAPEQARKTTAQVGDSGTANKTTARSRRGAAGTILAGSLGGGATILGN